MPIIRGPGYTTVAPRKVVVAAPKKGPVINVSKVPKIGYTGSGWNYPSAGMAPKVPLSVLPVTQTTPGVTGPTKSVPLSAVPSNFMASLADIRDNPMSQEALGQYNTNMQSLLRALKGTLGSAVTTSGYDPTDAFKQLLAGRPDLGEFNDLIDPAAIAAGNANPLSERALNEKNYGQQMAGLDYGLAARGIQGSGAQATGGSQILQSRQMAENASRQSLLNAIQGGIGGYLDKKTQGYNQLQDVYSQVAQLLAQQQGAVPVEGNATEEPQNLNEPGTNVPSAAMNPANYINWGGQQMTSLTQLKNWLAAHGQNLNTWAGQHQAAYQKLLGLR